MQLPLSWVEPDAAAPPQAADFTPATGTLTFAPGTTATQFISITVNGDRTNENDENFLVNLSNASNASLLKAIGTGTILNDDADPFITINSITAT